MRFGKVDVRILGVIGTLAFALLIILSVVLKQGADWWSAWGQWIGGLGSIAAAGTAVWIAVKGWRKSDQQAEKQARRLEQFEEREQASKVAAWLEKYESGQIQVMYANNSGLPIHELYILVEFSQLTKRELSDSDRQVSIGLGSFRPTTTPMLIEPLTKKLNEHLSEILTSLHGPDYKQGENQRSAHWDLLCLLYEPTIVVTFKDNGNLRWARHPNGNLERISEELTPYLALRFALDENTSKPTDKPPVVN